VSEFLPGEIGGDPDAATLKSTPLDALHRRLGARMVPFAGYAMPVQYPAGIIAEHKQCRERAALFDVSHMGQASLRGVEAAAALERLVPGDILGLKPFRQRYTLLLNEAGGILDDLMVANYGDRLFLVVNAARKEADYTHFADHLPRGLKLEVHENRALLALQGPAAKDVMTRLSPDAASLPFMAVGAFGIGGHACWVSRSGYTGEDGFEISVPAAEAEAFAEKLLAEPEVAPAGLGARDSLRLEAGLCLYGNDIDELTTPVEAGLTWTIGKRRKATWDFPGAAAIRDQLDNGPHRLRVGLRPEGRAPARAATPIVAADGTGAGTVTSGGFGPTVGSPVAMGYVRRDLTADGTQLFLTVRGKNLPATVVPMPFVPHRYIR
jgi:aminomethyltransferase